MDAKGKQDVMKDAPGLARVLFLAALALAVIAAQKTGEAFRGKDNPRHLPGRAQSSQDEGMSDG